LLLAALSGCNFLDGAPQLDHYKVTATFDRYTITTFSPMHTTVDTVSMTWIVDLVIQPGNAEARDAKVSSMAGGGFCASAFDGQATIVGDSVDVITKESTLGNPTLILRGHRSGAVISGSIDCTLLTSSSYVYSGTFVGSRE
jgi:hypothetical protein